MKDKKYLFRGKTLFEGKTVYGYTFDQVAKCGNAVTPPTAAALVRANLPEYCREAV